MLDVFVYWVDCWLYQPCTGNYLTKADAKAAIALANSEGNLETMYVGKVITRTRVVQPAVNPVDEDI